MLAVLSFTTIRNSLHTCATVKQSCYLVDPDSCLAFRVYTFQLISLTVWYSSCRYHTDITTLSFLCAPTTFQHSQTPTQFRPTTYTPTSHTRTHFRFNLLFLTLKSTKSNIMPQHYFVLISKQAYFPFHATTQRPIQPTQTPYFSIYSYYAYTTYESNMLKWLWPCW